MSTRETLRLAGYSSTPEGHVECYREGHPDECTGVLKIDIERDTKAGRELVDKLIALVDQPRALLGRKRDGSVIMLFKCDRPYAVEPHIAGENRRTGIFELATRDGDVCFVVTCKSVDMVVDISAYTWDKNRSPADFPRASLTLLTADVGERVVEGAFSLGCMWASMVAQERENAARVEQFKRDVKSGKAKLLSDAEIAEIYQSRADEETVAAHEGQKLHWSDGPYAQSVLRARARLADFRAKQATAAA